MSTARPRSPGPLVNQLNALLNALHVHVSLESPTDLTPSLLIAVLDALLSEHIPLEHSDQNHANGDVQNMKIFLGVLEHDILQMDAGLSDIDPRRLANGEWEEVVFVGELLCWVGRRCGFLDDPHDHRGPSKQPSSGTESPSASTTSVTTKANSDYNLSQHRHTDSDTSVTLSLEHPELFAPLPHTHKLSPLVYSPPQPRCIHEIPSPSFNFVSDLDSPFVDNEYLPCERPPGQEMPVRRTGYIEPADEEMEILSFEKSRSNHTLEQRGRDSRQPDYIQLQQARARTLVLLDERAHLLEELAKLKALEPS